MSEGNTKCKLFGNYTNFTTADKCTTGCNFYVPKNPNEKVEIPCALIGKCDVYVSDTKCNSECPEYKNVIGEEVKVDERPDVKLECSDLPKFDKLHEFFVMKKHVFQIQSVSPKKIILKYKKKLKDTDELSDGCYVFRDQKGDLLEPAKVFKKFEREAKEKARTKEAEYQEK